MQHGITMEAGERVVGQFESRLSSWRTQAGEPVAILVIIVATIGRLLADIGTPAPVIEAEGQAFLLRRALAPIRFQAAPATGTNALMASGATFRHERH